MNNTRGTVMRTLGVLLVLVMSGSRVWAQGGKVVGGGCVTQDAFLWEVKVENASSVPVDIINFDVRGNGTTQASSSTIPPLHIHVDVATVPGTDHVLHFVLAPEGTDLTQVAANVATFQGGSALSNVCKPADFTPVQGVFDPTTNTLSDVTFLGPPGQVKQLNAFQGYDFGPAAAAAPTETISAFNLTGQPVTFTLTEYDDAGNVKATSTFTSTGTGAAAGVISAQLDGHLVLASSTGLDGIMLNVANGTEQTHAPTACDLSNSAKEAEAGRILLVGCLGEIAPRPRQ
jgi:hypothetical protein